MRLGGVGIEQQGEATVAVILLSAAPSPAWIGYFMERAQASVLGAASARFRRNRIFIDLPSQEDLGSLIRSVEALIDNANFDMEFRGAG